MDKRQLEFDETKALIPNVKRCKRCHRKLKTAEALVHGYGAKCYKMLIQEKAFRKEELDGKS